MSDAVIDLVEWLEDMMNAHERGGYDVLYTVFKDGDRYGITTTIKEDRGEEENE